MNHDDRNFLTAETESFFVILSCSYALLCALRGQKSDSPRVESVCTIPILYILGQPVGMMAISLSSLQWYSSALEKTHGVPSSGKNESPKSNTSCCMSHATSIYNPFTCYFGWVCR